MSATKLDQHKGYTTENLMQSRDCKRVTEFSGKKIEFRPPTVFSDQISRATALSTVSSMDGMGDLLAKEVYKPGDTMTAEQEIAMTASKEVMNTQLEIELIFRCSFIAGTNNSFFFNSDEIRKLPMQSFTELQKELYSVLRFSPTSLDMTAEKFEELYEDFKKKDLISTIYTQEELGLFSTALVEKHEALIKGQQEKPF